MAESSTPEPAATDAPEASGGAAPAEPIGQRAGEYPLRGAPTWFHGLMRMVRWSVFKGPSTVADRRLSEVNLHWLIHLRWTAIAGQLITILVVRYILEVEIPLPALFTILLVEFGTNAGLLLFQQNELLLRESDAQEGPSEFTDRRLQLVKLGVTLLDIGLLSTLLSLTGGATNPFCGFLLVHVALGSVLLPLRHSLVAVGALGLAMIMIMEYAMPVPALDANPDLRGWGTVVALSLTSLLTVLFVNRVVSTLDTRAQELESERGRRERQRHLEALGTLAAGAAHELGTPLSTITLVAKELELALEQEPAVGDAVTEDARLIRDEVARCRRILNRMSATAGDRVGESLARGALHGHPGHRAERHRCVASRRVRAAPRRARGVRAHRHGGGPRFGNDGRGGRARARALLHHQGRRQRYGPWALPRELLRGGPRRQHRDPLRARPRHGRGPGPAACKVRRADRHDP